MFTHAMVYRNEHAKNVDPAYRVFKVDAFMPLGGSSIDGCFTKHSKNDHTENNE